MPLLSKRVANPPPPFPLNPDPKLLDLDSLITQPCGNLSLLYIHNLGVLDHITYRITVSSVEAIVWWMRLVRILSGGAFSPHTANYSPSFSRIRWVSASCRERVETVLIHGGQIDVLKYINFATCGPFAGTLHEKCGPDGALDVAMNNIATELQVRVHIRQRERAKRQRERVNRAPQSQATPCRRKHAQTDCHQLTQQPLDKYPHKTRITLTLPNSGVVHFNDHIATAGHRG